MSFKCSLVTATRVSSVPPGGGEPSMYVSCVYGCVVSSDVDLNFPPATAGSPIEVTLHQARDRYNCAWEPAPADLMSRHRNFENGHGYVSARVPDGYRLRFDDCCEFDLNAALDQIVWRLAPGADSGLVPIMAAGALMSLKFMLAGELVLHSSAVTFNGRGLAFVGRSGMGKSTMATVMCTFGATMITDDVGRVRFDADDVKLVAGAHESRLRASAASLAELVPASSVRRTGDGRLAVSLRRSRLAESPLDAVVVPLPAHEGTALQLRALGARDAVLTIAMFPRLSGLIDREMQARQFEQIARLVDRVPVFAATIPWGGALDDRTAAALVGALGWARAGDSLNAGQATCTEPAGTLETADRAGE